jgi:TPR repeat protein
MKVLCAGLVAIGAALPVPAGAVDRDDAYQRALLEYECGHYAQSIQNFRVAAELGEARSPAVLALMYRMGQRLYGDQVQADEPEAARWAAVAANRYRTALTASALQDQ